MKDIFASVTIAVDCQRLFLSLPVTMTVARRSKRRKINTYLYPNAIKTYPWSKFNAIDCCERHLLVVHWAGGSVQNFISRIPSFIYCLRALALMSAFCP